jgi:hypothetical protein
MKTFLPLLAFFLAPFVIVAQTTWQGLSFGSSATHVRDVLSRQPPVCTYSNGDDHDCVAFTMEQLPAGSPGDWTVNPPLELWLPALASPLHFNAFLTFFDTDRQLARIDLRLDTDRHKAEGKNAPDLVDYAGEPVLAELLGRYGPPLEMSAACEPAEARRLLRTRADPIDCNVLWKADSQTVNLAWKYSAVSKTYSLIIRYAWVRSGL